METFDIPSEYRSVLINSVQLGTIVCVPHELREKKLLFPLPPRSVFMIHSTKAAVSYRINIRVCVCSRQIVLPVRQELSFPITLR